MSNDELAKGILCAAQIQFFIDFPEGAAFPDSLREDIKTALDLKDTQISSLTAEVERLKKPEPGVHDVEEYYREEKPPTPEEEVKSLTAEVERLMDLKYEPFREQMDKQDKEIEKLKRDVGSVFNVGVEQSNEIVGLTAKLRIAEDGLLDIANDLEFSNDVHGKFVREVWYQKRAKEVLSQLRQEEKS